MQRGRRCSGYGNCYLRSSEASRTAVCGGNVQDRKILPVLRINTILVHITISLRQIRQMSQHGHPQARQTPQRADRPESHWLPPTVVRNVLNCRMCSSEQKQSRFMDTGAVHQQFLNSRDRKAATNTPLAMRNGALAPEN